MQFEAPTSIATKMYSEYIAGANGVGNEEMRQTRGYYVIKRTARVIGSLTRPATCSEREKFKE